MSNFFTCFSMLSSELEIDKGLYLTAFYLDDQIDDSSDEEGTQHYTAPLQHTHATRLEGIGHEMGDIAKQHHGEDNPIAGDNLLEELRWKLVAIWVIIVHEASKV